jgi:hypothetical protein
MIENGGFIPKETLAGEALLAMQQKMGIEIQVDPADDGMSIRVIDLINEHLAVHGTNFAELMKKDMR